MVCHIVKSKLTAQSKAAYEEPERLVNVFGYRRRVKGDEVWGRVIAATKGDLPVHTDIPGRELCALDKALPLPRVCRRRVEVGGETFAGTDADDLLVAIDCRLNALEDDAMSEICGDAGDGGGGDEVAVFWVGDAESVAACSEPCAVVEEQRVVQVRAQPADVGQLAGELLLGEAEEEDLVDRADGEDDVDFISDKEGAEVVDPRLGRARDEGREDDEFVTGEAKG